LPPAHNTKDILVADRDRRLLEAAGLTVSEAAVLLGRTKAALYTGLSNSRRTYFSAQDAATFLRHTKQTDSSRIDELNKFISNNYPASESDSILPDRISKVQAGHVVDKADQIILVFNGNVSHLTTTGTTFEKLLLELLELDTPQLGLIVPSNWVIEYIETVIEKINKERMAKEQNVRLLRIPDHRVFDPNVSYLPSFILTANETAARGFFFGRHALEEVPPRDATELWSHFVPMFGESFGHRDRAVG
jgi:hypothetical protein